MQVSGLAALAVLARAAVAGVIGGMMVGGVLIGCVHLAERDIKKGAAK